MTTRNARMQTNPCPCEHTRFSACDTMRMGGVQIDENTPEQRARNLVQPLIEARALCFLDNILRDSSVVATLKNF